jgi:hypothetical protein
MKLLFLLPLLLALFATPLGETPGGSGIPLTSERLVLAEGAGFWGGLVCGAAAGGLALGTMAIITAAGAGTTLPAGVALGTSVSLEVFAVCLAIS